MSRTRLILLCPLAVVAIVVAASASASEPPVKCGGTVTTTPNYCVAGFQLENSKGETVSENVVGTNGVSILKAVIGSVKSEIKCGTGKSKGTIENGTGGTVGKSVTKTTFEACKLVKPTSCKLTSVDETSIPTTELNGQLTLVSGKIDEKFEPRVGDFTTISIEGKESSCVIAEVGKPKSFNVSGSQLCEVDTSAALAETESTTHKIICKDAGSSLEIGTNPAEMEDEAAVELSGTKAHDTWSVKEHA